MGFVKVIKDKAYFKRYQTKFRRRRECKTDYYARQRMINQDQNKYNTPKHRLVVRFTGRDVVCQIVAARLWGDEVVAAAYSHELPRYGLSVGLTNYAAAYATGLLVARRLLDKFGLAERHEGNTGSPGEEFYVEEAEDGPNSFSVILDVGLKRTTSGAKVFAAMKGAVDGGLDIPYSPQRFVGYDNDRKRLDSEELARQIYGGHVADYMNLLKEENPEKYNTHFSQYIKAGITADNLEDTIKATHAAIRKNPKPQPTKKKESYPRPKRVAKRSIQQRKSRVQQKIANWARANAAESDEE